MTIRGVVEGTGRSRYASVERARELLRDGPASLRRLSDDLGAALTGEPDVLIDRPSRLLYATDASLYEMEPVAVVFPRGAEDVGPRLRWRRGTGCRSCRAGAGRVWRVRA